MVNEEELNELEESQPLEEGADALPADNVPAEAPESFDESISSSSDDQETPADTKKKSQEVDDGRAWYVIHCYSGYEKKVRHNLEQRIETMGMKDMIFDVVIPTQEEIEVKEGKRRSIERHVFPGYVLVNLILTEESWYVVRNTPGVTGFVGMGNEPTPLRSEEVAQVLKRMEAEAPHVNVSFKTGERVRIIDGPFNDFRGTVSEIDMDYNDGFFTLSNGEDWTEEVIEILENGCKVYEVSTTDNVDTFGFVWEEVPLTADFVKAVKNKTEKSAIKLAEKILNKVKNKDVDFLYKDRYNAIYIEFKEIPVQITNKGRTAKICGYLFDASQIPCITLMWDYLHAKKKRQDIEKLAKKLDA